MKCPHCTVDFHHGEQLMPIGKDADGFWGVGVSRCSACCRLILRLFAAEEYYSASNAYDEIVVSYLVRPKTAARSPIPPEVPKKYAGDYNEACLVLADSPKASAALSRRCLQRMLREQSSVKKGDLAAEIQQVLDAGTFPSHILDALDAIRNIGNFAAHPIKSQSTGEMVEVESGEAEWNLDVLEALFDFYFVAPARTASRKAALNRKLADAGKPQMK